MTDTPTEGAVRAADWIHTATGPWTYHTIPEIADAIDREAVAPAVQDLILAVQRIVGDMEAQGMQSWPICVQARAIILKHRRLTDQATDQEVA